MDYSYYYEAARQALDYHAGILSPANTAWLKGLPYKQERNDIGLHLCHESLGRCGFIRVFAIQPQTVRLYQWQVMFECKLLDCRRLQFHATASRAIGLGEHTHHVVAGGMQRRQGTAGKFRGARKNHAHENSFWLNN